MFELFELINDIMIFGGLAVIVIVSVVSIIGRIYLMIKKGD